MNEAIERRLGELEAAVRADPGGPAFPELADLHRRAGRLERAEQIARLGLKRAPGSPRGRAVLLLVLADAGRQDELRRRLESWVEADADAPPSGWSEGEFERAFEAAEPELEAMITPDRVAEEATLRADGLYAAASPLETGAFTTRTMAELLERQGDASGAARIRATLEAARPAPDAHPSAAPQRAARRERAIPVLERWLANARRMQA